MACLVLVSTSDGRVGLEGTRHDLEQDHANAHDFFRLVMCFAMLGSLRTAAQGLTIPARFPRRRLFLTLQKPAPDPPDGDQRSRHREGGLLFNGHEEPPVIRAEPGEDIRLIS